MQARVERRILEIQRVAADDIRDGLWARYTPRYRLAVNLLPTAGITPFEALKRRKPSALLSALAGHEERAAPAQVIDFY